MISIRLICFHQCSRVYFISFKRGRCFLPAKDRSHHNVIETLQLYHFPDKLYDKISQRNIGCSLNTLIVKLLSANSGQSVVNTDL